MDGNINIDNLTNDPKLQQTPFVKDIVYSKLKKDQLLTKLPDFNFYDINQVVPEGEEKKKLGVFIAGGAIRDSLLGEKYSDIDIFGSSLKDLDTFTEQNLSTAQGYRQVYFNKNLRTYKKGKTKVQIIYREYESLEATLNDFDFTVTQFAYDGDDIYCNPQSLLDVHHKRIIINNINPLYVLDTVRRVQKYIQKGYTICNGGIKDILDKAREITQEEYDQNIEFYPNTEEFRIIRFD